MVMGNEENQGGAVGVENSLNYTLERRKQGYEPRNGLDVVVWRFLFR
jgi:hypothetical protein